MRSLKDKKSQMSSLDCPDYWKTPCECGYEYIDFTLERLTKMRDLFDRLIKRKETELAITNKEKEKGEEL